MVSPGVILSSPTLSRRRGAHKAASSSPELPSVHRLLSQRPDETLVLDDDGQRLENAGALAKLQDDLHREHSSGAQHGLNPPPDKTIVHAREDGQDLVESLNLELAASRRRDWTPPPEANHILIDSDSSGLRDTRFRNENEGLATESFKSLLESYRCQGSTQIDKTAILEEKSAIIERQLTVNHNHISARASSLPSRNEEQVIHQRVTRGVKKPRTITGLATAAYNLATHSLRDIATPAEAESEAVSLKKLPRKKASRTSRKKTKPKISEPSLLPPNAALERVADQDFVFGTASQLVRGQAPSSTGEFFKGGRIGIQLDCIDLVTPANSDASEPPERQQTLWHAGARDAEGDLFDVDVCDMATVSPQLPAPADEADPFGYVKAGGPPVSLVEMATRVPDDTSFVDLSDILHPSDICHAISGSSQHETDLCSDAQISKATMQRDPKVAKMHTAAMTTLDKIPPAESCIPDAQTNALTSQTTRATETGNLLSLSTSAALSMGEKRTRGRPKKASVVGETEQEPPPSGQPPESPNRSKRKTRAAASGVRRAVKMASTRSETRSGRPQDGRLKRAMALAEVPDSESDVPGSWSVSAISSPEASCSTPEPIIDLTVSMHEDMGVPLTETLLTGQQTELFTSITRAVRSAPRTTNPHDPSWHEKMLLYDPIVLEDLTSWLNNDQLSRVGYQGEVSATEVKKWCESKSICCLWRVNLRGRERKRY